MNGSATYSLELVGVLEVDLCKRSSSAGLVNDLLDGTLAVSLAIGVIKSFHLGSSLSQLGMRAENGSSSFSLTSNDASHSLNRLLQYDDW